MKNRNPIAVVLLSFITLGIYSIYWEVSTKGEMNKLGAEIPTAWLILVPFVNIWWLWKYSEGVEKVTGGKLSGILSFVLLWLAGIIGQAVVQDSFNNIASNPVPTPVPVAPVGSTAPTTSTPDITPPNNETIIPPTI